LPKRLSLTLLILLALSGAMPTAQAQDNDNSVLTFNPPVTTIELSDVEPLPNGVSSTIYWAGGGLGGPRQLAKPFANPGLYWVKLPDPLSSPFVNSNTMLRITDDLRYDPSITKQIIVGNFQSCGYTNSTPPKATITYPSGKNEAINGLTPAQPTETDNGKCWKLSINWLLGMERGLYTLTLDHTDGQILHKWGIDYPRCGTVLDTSLPKPADSKQTARLIMGFIPNETLTINIYTDTPSQVATASGTLTFVAQRQVKLDEEGATLLDIKLSRSSPLQLWMMNYYYMSAGGKYYGYDPLEWYTGDNALNVADAETGGFPERPCAPDPYIDNALAIPLFDRPDDNATKLAELAPKSNAEILETKALTRNRRVTVWYHVLMPDNREGWVPSLGKLDYERPLMFDTAFARVLPNQQFVRQVEGSLDYERGNVDFGLYQDHDPASTKFGTLTAGTIVQIKQGQEFDTYQNQWIKFEMSNPLDHPYTTIEDVWWEVVTPDGITGWTHVGLQSVAWGIRPDSEVVSTDPEITTTPAASPTPQFVCASPSTRLTVGGKGQVMPPKSNRMRQEPGGEAIGKIAVGDSFTVLDGPQCTPDGTVWWKVDYKGTVGWTAEGDGKEFWVEPVQ
jgi:hypothetical protein